MNGNRPQAASAATAEAASFGNAAVEGAEVQLQLQLQVVPSSRSESCMSLSIYRQLAWALLTRIIMHSPRHAGPTCRSKVAGCSCTDPRDPPSLHVSCLSLIPTIFCGLIVKELMFWKFVMSIIGALYFEVFGVSLCPIMLHTHTQRQTHTHSLNYCISVSALNKLMSFNTINLSLLISVPMGQTDSRDMFKLKKFNKSTTNWAVGG